MSSSADVIFSFCNDVAATDDAIRRDIDVGGANASHVMVVDDDKTSAKNAQIAKREIILQSIDCGDIQEPRDAREIIVIR